MDPQMHRAENGTVPHTKRERGGEAVHGWPEAAEKPLALLGGEGVLGHRVKVSHEEDGQGADGKEQDGQPEAELVNHLSDQHPVLHLLGGGRGKGQRGGAGGQLFWSWSH